MASHKPSLKALVDIKGRNENLSSIVKQKGRNNTAKTHNRLKLSTQLEQNWENLLFIYLMGNIKVKELDDVSTCYLFCTLSLPGEECHRGLSVRSDTRCLHQCKKRHISAQDTFISEGKNIKIYFIMLEITVNTYTFYCKTCIRIKKLNK